MCSVRMARGTDHRRDNSWAAALWYRIVYRIWGTCRREKLEKTAQYSSQTDHAEDHGECFAAVSKIKSQTCKEDAAWHTDIKNKTTLLIIHGDLL